YFFMTIEDKVIIGKKGEILPKKPLRDFAGFKPGDEVLIEAYKGQLIIIMGVSGSGKSTLLHLVGGIDSPTAGTILSCNHVITDLPEHELAEYRKKDVGFIFQFENLSPILTAKENIELPMRMLGTPREERKKRSNELLSWLNMESRADHPPHALSGGERQRIATLVALANDPELILADEPTGELDSENSNLLAQLLKNMNIDFGKTILLVTHNPEVAHIGEKVLEMRDGEIRGEMQPQVFALFCSKCQKESKRTVNFCSTCGTLIN
ncbi:MAG: ATP-binding cassette domain-containing protein, partial [Candidatus Hodarchaeota archaeon]